MNKTELMGRLTKDPEVKSGNESTVAKFTVAVDRKPGKNGQTETDFISCVAFGKTAEFIGKYFHKGERILVCGRIQTGSYTNKEGTKVYTTDVVSEEVEFVEKAVSAGTQPQQAPAPQPYPQQPQNPYGFAGGYQQ